MPEEDGGKICVSRTLISYALLRPISIFTVGTTNLTQMRDSSPVANVPSQLELIVFLLATLSNLTILIAHQQ